LDGTVVNVLEVDSLPAPPEWKDWGLYQGELIECADEVGIGWTYVDGEFSAPPEIDNTLPEAPDAQPDRRP
jgi:hypothetical protein